MGAVINLPLSCLHHVAVERISSLLRSNNCKRGVSGTRFGGLEGGGGIEIKHRMVFSKKREAAGAVFCVS